MAAFFSNISASVRKSADIYLLFLPTAGIVVYSFLFHVTKPSPLLLSTGIEKLFAVVTITAFAFILAAVISIVLAIIAATGDHSARKITDHARLVIFALLATLLALIVAENFTYTMFKFGIRNTSGSFAKLAYLVISAGLFWAFLKQGPKLRHQLAATNFTKFNAAIALFCLVAMVNVSGSLVAPASADSVLARRHNIVILSSDGIDASRMSFYGYQRKTTPFLDSIADEVLTARNAYPNNGHTTGSVTSLLTGMLPTRTKVVFPPDSLQGADAYRTLPRLLRQRGYFASNIAVPHYADASEQNLLEAFDINNNRKMLSSTLSVSFRYKMTTWFFDRTLSEATGIVKDVLWLQEMPNPYAQVDGEKRGTKYGFNDAARLRHLVSHIGEGRTPFFVNTHFLGTHGPWFNPEQVSFSRKTGDDARPWNRDRYDDAVLTFDAYIKRVYSALAEKGILEKTIIVIMSDHGIRHDPRKKIPLMIRFPGKKHGGTIIESNVQVIDIAPTIIDFLGGKAPTWMEGDSLIRGPIAPDRHIFSASVEKIRFAKGVGVIGTNGGKFGAMSYFYLVHCNASYRLDVVSQNVDVTANTDGDSACQADQQLSRDAAKTVMLDHLKARY